MSPKGVRLTEGVLPTPGTRDPTGRAASLSLSLPSVKRSPGSKRAGSMRNGSDFL